MAERSSASPPSRDPELLVDCTAMIRAHHQEAGAMLLHSWNMVPTLARAAASHHAELPPAGESAGWSLGILGAGLAERVTGSEDLTQAKRVTREQFARASSDLAIEPGDLQRALPKLGKELEGVLESLA